MDDPTCIYGQPPVELAAPPPGARQVSPLIPGAEALEGLAPASLARAVVAAPAGTLERRYVLALAVRALRPGGELLALAPKARGGARLGEELAGFGCVVRETGRRHHRICSTVRPEAPQGLEAAIAAGAPRRSPALGCWTQPGVFSWDRPDPGTDLLLAGLPPLCGRGADLGCGLGGVAQAVLAQGGVTALDLVDLDRRAVEAARRNVADLRAAFHWADARAWGPNGGLDFVAMNPPFHDEAGEARALGQDFVRAARRLVRRGGLVRLVANRHLPYEALMAELFARAEVKASAHGFKVLEGRA